MTRGRGRGVKRGGGRSFSKHLELDENGIAVSQDKKWVKRGEEAEDSDEEEEEEEEESSEEEEEAPAPSAGPSTANVDPTIARAAKKLAKQQLSAKKALENVDEDDDDDADLVNPNRVASKNLKASDLSATKAPSRREREEKDKKDAKERYQKMHAAGKTDEAKADLGRLAKIRKEREEAQAKRKAEQEAKAAELEAKKAASGQGSRR